MTLSKTPTGARLTPLAKMIAYTVTCMPLVFSGAGLAQQKKATLKLPKKQTINTTSVRAAVPPPSPTAGTFNGRSFEYLFKLSPPASFKFYASLTGRDPDLLRETDTSLTTLKSRHEQIATLMRDAAAAQVRSESYVTLRQALAKTLEQQALVLEMLRAAGIEKHSNQLVGDSLYRIRRLQAQTYLELLLIKPTHPEAAAWKLGQLSTRIRLRDPGARGEVEKLQQESLTPEVKRLSVVQLATDAGNAVLPKVPAPLHEAIERTVDPYELGVLRLLLAEVQMQNGDKAQAFLNFRDSLNSLGSLNSLIENGTTPLILSYIAGKMSGLDLEKGCTGIDDVLTAFAKNNLVFHAAYYAEKCALEHNLNALNRAIYGYKSILTVAQQNEEIKTKVEFRMLELTLASREYQMFLPAWQRFLNQKLHLERDVTPFVTLSMQTLLNEQKISGSRTLANSLASLHDLFQNSIQSYVERNEYTLPILTVLHNVNQHKDVIVRVEKALANQKDKDTQTKLIDLSTRSHLKVLGAQPDFGFSPDVKVDPANATFKSLAILNDKMLELSPKDLSDLPGHLTVQMRVINNKLDEAQERFKEVSKAPSPSALNAHTSQFILAKIKESNNAVETEKFLKFLKGRGIVPVGLAAKQVAIELENASLAIADTLNKEKKHTEAAEKFVAFQKEFPNSLLAASALEKAAAAYLEAGNIALAIQNHELHLKMYPKSTNQMEILWMVAELRAKNNDHANAAKEYLDFAKAYRNEGTKRRSLHKAAENFRQAGNFKESEKTYKKILAKLKMQSEKLDVMSALAEIAGQQNNTANQLEILNQMLKLISDADSISTVYTQIMMVHLKSGRDDLSAKTAEQIIGLKVDTPDGAKNVAVAKSVRARFESRALEQATLTERTRLSAVVEKLSKDYEAIKSNLQAPCEFSLAEWCVLGLYRSAELNHTLVRSLTSARESLFSQADTADTNYASVTSTLEKMAADLQQQLAKTEEMLSAAQNLDAQEVEAIKTFIADVRAKQPTTPQPANDQQDSSAPSE